MESSTLARRLVKALIIGSIVLSMYVAGYGLMRWRKVLVRAAVPVPPPGQRPDKGQPIVYCIREGHDYRTVGVGAFKNAIAKPVEVFFAPVCWTEARVWNAM